MKSKFISFNEETGEITGVGSSKIESLEYMKKDVKNPNSYIPIDNIDIDLRDKYIVNNQLKVKPQFVLQISSTTINADGSEVFTINGIPNETKYTITGVATDFGVINDGYLSIATDLPGIYRIKLSNFPYQDLKIELEAI